MGTSFNDARKKVEGFSSAAGDAAKTTVEGAKDAADCCRSHSYGTRHQRS